LLEAVMREDVEVPGARALPWGLIDCHQQADRALAGRRRWSADPKLAILGELFGSDGSVGATAKRKAIGCGQRYTWHQRALADDRDRSKHRRRIICRGG